MESYTGPATSAGRSVTYPHGVSSRCYLERDGMSIVPSPGQMGPGSGSIGVLMRHPTLFKGLGMGPAIGGVSAALYLADLQRARAEGFGNDVQAYRDRMADKVIAEWVVPITLLVMPVHPDKGLSSQSSGGGGPGGLPNLHQPPPSIEETGEILSNPPIAGEVPSSPRRSTSKKAGQCPYYLREIRAGRKYWQKGRVFRGRGGKSYDISKHDRCAKRAGHSGRHSFSGPFHSKGNITSYLKRLHG